MFVCLEEQNEENWILPLNNPDPDPQNTVTPAHVYSWNFKVYLEWIISEQIQQNSHDPDLPSR